MKSPMLAIGVTALVLALAGCAPSGDVAETAKPATSPTPSTPSAEPTLTQEPSPAETTEPSAPAVDYVSKVPADCSDVGTAAVNAATFGDMPQQPAIGVTEARVPLSAKMVLDCGWFQGDVTGALVQYVTVPEADGQARIEQWRGEGASCEAAANYTWCRKDLTRKYNDMDIANTDWIMFDGSLFIYVNASYMDATALQEAIATQVWS